LAVIRRETRGTSTYLHGKLLPDRRHPVKAGSGEAGARHARQPLPDGAGLAAWRQAGGAT